MIRSRLEALPGAALLALVLGLPFHNIVMATLWGSGVRGGALDVIAAWKDVVLVVGVGAALVSFRTRLSLAWADRLALGYLALVVVYWALPQSLLGDGDATARGEVLALRHHLLPVGAYAIGRLAVLSAASAKRVALGLLAGASAIAVWGLVDVFALPLDTWRSSGVPGWFTEQLGFSYECLSNLPENWIFNTGDETNPLRRLTSTFLSPLATGYALVVVLLLVAARRRVDRVAAVVGVLAAAGLLYTHTRAALVALAIGLVVIAARQRARWPLAIALVWLGLAAGFVAAYPTIGPSTSYTSAELACLRDLAAAEGGTEGDGLGTRDPARRGQNLRDGVETVLRHPQGYGLGNAGVTASRTGAPILAGESTYTELGVDAGLLTALVFIGWLAALFAGAWRRSAWVASTVVVVAALALQTDVIGVHWLTVVVFGFAGVAITRDPRVPPPEEIV